MMTPARFAFALSVLAAVSCAQPAPAPPAAPVDTRPADEAAIRAAVKEWAAASQAKDVEKFVSFYADNAVVMMERAPDLTGKAAIHTGLQSMMQDPNFALSFETDSVVVARSGDLASEAGAYSMSMSDPKKKAATEKGHYIVVWQKQADGAWKVLRDVPVSDPAEGAAK